MTAGVYTVGYSGRSIEEFLSLLGESSISVIADVRSQPFSKFNSEFNQDSLRYALKQVGISYAFLGAELGARTSDENCYVAGKVQYDLIAVTPSFKAGLDRVQKGCADHRIALMCAESDPLSCHRCILVSRYLSARGIPVRHILGAGITEDHDATVQRLVQLLRIPELCSSCREEDLLSMAYRIQGERIAYRRDPVHAVQYELWGQETA